jgi:hypothetical protein
MISESLIALRRPTPLRLALVCLVADAQVVAGVLNLSHRDLARAADAGMRSIFVSHISSP